MTQGDGHDDRIRERFGSPPPGAASREDCPEADRFWLAARGHVPFAETQALLDHGASCAACTIAWRLAREQAVADGVAVAARPRRVMPYAVAAVLFLAVGGVALREWSNRRADPAALRATGEPAIRAAIPDGAGLPRRAFVLRWTSGPAGTRYTVLVSDERLGPIAEGANLDVPEYQVPAAALGALPAGARVLWQIRADLPDGTRIATPTFVARVADAPGP